MSSTQTSVAQICERAKAASRKLALASSETKDAALEEIAIALVNREAEILAANELDMAAGRDADLTEALLDRLSLDSERLAGIAKAVRDIASLPDPIGEVLDGYKLANGLLVEKVRVPLGVIAVVYEARPNVTVDAAALCLKSGNSIVLRGSSSATHSNAVLAAVTRDAVERAGLPADVVTLVAGGGREELTELATQDQHIDLVIPRGGEGLKAALKDVATVPIIYAASGNCHVYVDKAMHPEMAEQIVVNAKTQRPGVCNAAETLLVHEHVARTFIPRVVDALRSAGVNEFRVDERAAEQLPDGDDITAATDEDWGTEYLAPIIAIGVVSDVDEAIEHINEHGSGHSEAIVTRDLEAAQAFQRQVDAACVYVNASTRFTDGGEFGMGAEIGNATQKLHARGPIGMRELTTYRYLIEGSGQIRS